MTDEADLIFKIKAFGEEKLTKVIRKQGPGSKTFWGVHFFFNKKFDMREDLENSNYEIELLDYNSVLRNDLIGKTSGSVQSIYSQEKHMIVNKWAILANTDKISLENTGFMGFLKFSISFAKSSEARINLEEAAHKD